ncbi:MAG TPA: cyclic nucleotide-binding domain-containing protein [Methylomirabilota bacterium]|nr:cyclic nucleotide-binding domain-containing protein [Methylomirabilota bacterium]
MTTDSIQLTIDGSSVTVPAGTTIYEAARTLGIEIPVLCHDPQMAPVGVCRVCTVDVEGARLLPAACVRPAENGMVVQTNSERVRKARATLLELLLADHPTPCMRQVATRDCELETLAARDGVTASRFAARPAPRGPDDSSVIIHVDHAACILCDRCIRACSDIKENFVIGRTGKGPQAGIAFDLDQPMADSSCVSCGECMVSCPTGALTNKAVPGAAFPPGPPLDAGELLALPMFRGVSGNFLELNRGAVTRRTFAPGEIICREGEYGSTAFYILNGKVDVFISIPMAHVKSRARQTGGGVAHFFRKLTDLVSSHDDPREEGPRRFIPIDAPVDLDYDNPIAQLGPGDLFGEMTCMSFYPRSATVRAVEETVVLEMLRNVLSVLQRNRRFKAQLDETYRQRALDTHLRSVPLFDGVTDDFLRQLATRIELVRFEPGQVIFRQGDRADSFYLVRIGFVKVTKSFPGGDLVVAYQARGSYFGEIGLLEDDGRRIATCTALDHVELVKIGAEEFRDMLQRFPPVAQRLTEAARERQESNQTRAEMARAPIDEFLGQGLMEAQNLLLIDLERCTRCDLCVRACADAHDGVTRLVRDGLRYDKYLVATSCRSCRDPLCMVGCPVGSIRRRASLEIVIEDWCIGCGLCAESCPYGNINMHPFTIETDDHEGGHRKAAVREKATTCDLSADYREPACVYACPHDAAIRVNPTQFFGDKLGLRP